MAKMFIHKVTDAFDKAKIIYAVVGGYAVALHGAVRGTVDIDFAINWDLANLKRVEKTLKALGLVSIIPVDADQIFKFRDEYVFARNMIAWNFFNPLNPLEQVDILINYDLKGARIECIGKINVLSKSDLIAMKKLSDRIQDKEDVKSLESL